MSAAEESLVIRAQAGDRDAFGELISRYDREVLAFAARYAGGAVDGEDLYQEIFLHCFQSLPRFERRSSFRTWLYQIAIHRCRSALRKRRRAEPPAVEDRQAPVDLEPLLQLEDVRRALDRLGHRQRLCFVLHHVQEWSLAEIEEVTGMRNGTIKTHLYRARQKLKSAPEVLRWKTS